MTAILGMLGTGSFSANQRPTNFRQKLLYEYPEGGAVLTMLLGMLKEESTDDPKFNIFEQGLPDQRHKLQDAGDGAAGQTGAGADTWTQFNLDWQGVGDTFPAKKFRIGHILYIERTGERVRVTGIDGTNFRYITVTRGWGTATVGVSGIAIASDDYLTIIGSSNPEGAGVGTPISFAPTEIYNYTQIFRTPMSLTGTAMKTFLRTGNVNKEEKFQKAVEHAMTMEKAFLFGIRDQQNGVGADGSVQPIRTTGGLTQYLTTNVGNFTTTGVTKADLNDFLRGIYTVPGGSGNKVALCGAKVLGVLNDYGEANSSINVEPKDSTYGLTIRTLYHAWGELKLVHHPLLSEHTEFTKWMFIIDTRNIVYRYMEDRDTKWLQNRQNPGEDRVVHEWLSECGLELQHERTHGYAYGIEEYVP